MDGDAYTRFRSRQLFEVPVGYKLVPIEPTEAMKQAYIEYAQMRLKSNNIPTILGGWSAMLNAAPEMLQLGRDL